MLPLVSQEKSVLPTSSTCIANCLYCGAVVCPASLLWQQACTLPTMIPGGTVARPSPSQMCDTKTVGGSVVGAACVGLARRLLIVPFSHI
jgi:hypothetical protein